MCLLATALRCFGCVSRARFLDNCGECSNSVGMDNCGRLSGFECDRERSFGVGSSMTAAAQDDVLVRCCSKHHYTPYVVVLHTDLAFVSIVHSTFWCLPIASLLPWNDSDAARSVAAQ